MPSHRLFVPFLLLLALGCGGRTSGPDTPAPAEGALGRSDTGVFGEGSPPASDVGVDRVHYESVVEMLRGMAPGLLVTSTGEIRIRGVNQSMGGSSGHEPLVVVDGMPSSRSAGATLRALRPSEVASITVLKDVASTVNYGIRGANGVIIVTTKKQSS